MDRRREWSAAFAIIACGTACSAAPAPRGDASAADAGMFQSVADAGDAAGSPGASGAGGRAGSRGGGAAGSDGPRSAGRAITLRFEAKVFDEAFACGRSYRGVGTSAAEVTPADLRFFVQDVRLFDAAGTAVPVALDDRSPWQVPGVALLDFADLSGSCHGTEERNAEITGVVPPGSYRGLSFRNGVPEQRNHEPALEHPPPLQVGDMSWGWLTGFKFFVAEVRTVASADDDAGTVGAGGGALVHVGSAGCDNVDGPTKCALANRNQIRFMDFDPDKNVIVVDVGALFATTDLSQDVQCHSDADACAELFARVGVDWETGASRTEQHVFRVE